MNKEYVASVLRGRLSNRETQFLDLTMNNGDRVSIDDMFGYYIWFSAIQNGTTVKDFDELVDILINYPAKMLEVKAQEEEWFADNEPKIREYFSKNFKGKEWEEIRYNEVLWEQWSFYSDWHKDVFGFRPRAVVCGTRA